VHHTRLAEAITVYDPQRSSVFDFLTGHGLGPRQAYGAIDFTVTNQAFVMAANDVFWMASLAIVVVTSIIWLARPPFHFMQAAVASE